jgi:hypothetical protein
MGLPFFPSQLFWPSQPFGVFTWARHRLAYFLVRDGIALLLFQQLTLHFRRFWVLPTDVDGGNVHRDSIHLLWEAVRPGQRCYPWGSGSSRLRPPRLIGVPLLLCLFFQPLFLYTQSLKAVDDPADILSLGRSRQVGVGISCLICTCIAYFVQLRPVSFLKKLNDTHWNGRWYDASPITARFCCGSGHVPSPSYRPPLA